MKLADLRKLSIRKQLKIRFQLPNGLECVVNERGVAQVPGLRRVPDFNLESDLASVSEFVLEPAGMDPKSAAKPQIVGRDALAAMAMAGVSAAVSEHEED